MWIVPRDTQLPPDLLRVSACSHPFKSARTDYTLPVGLTVSQIIESVQVDPILRQHGIVFIGDELVPRDFWHLVKPKHNSIISIKLLPTGGGALRLVATIAIAAIAIAATVALGPAGFAIMGAGGAALVGAGITIGGGLLLNLLLPPPVPKMSKGYGTESVTYAITGARNRARPWEKVPFLCGRFKIVPPYAALPYREVIGNEVYWRALFAIAHGPIYYENFAIGQTAISNFTGVEMEFRRGYWSMEDKGSWNAGGGALPSAPQFGDTWTISGSGSVDGHSLIAGQQITYNGLLSPQNYWAWDIDQKKPFSLFPSDVYEDNLSSAVRYGAPPTRTTQINADEIGIELIFERGLVHIQNNPPGKRSDRQITIAIQQSPVGQNNWSNVLTTTITGRQTSPLYWGWRWRTSDVGAQSASRQYDVRVHNLTGNQDEDRNFGNFSWYALRTFTMVNPAAVAGVAMVSVRIRSSGQLSGALEEFNLVATSICRDWDALSNSWVWRPTSSPAAHYRHLLQHPTRMIPSTDAQIDLAKLAYWDTITRSSSRNFNGVFDSKGSLYDALVEICRVGRATPTLRELIYSVIIDEPKTVPVRMFTPANSWDYSGEMTHATVPNAYRIGYVDAAKDYSTAEVVVYDDGYDASTARRTELVQWVGIDNQGQAWREGRFHLAQQRLRRETHRISTDFEHLACERGDLVALQYDTISVGSGAARVTAVTEVGASVVSVNVDRPFTMEAGKNYGIRVRRIVNDNQRTDSYDIETVPGENPELTLLGAPQIFDAPRPGDLVAFGERGRETLRALVRDIEPKSDLSAILTLISEAPGIHVAEFGPIPEYDPVVTVPQQLPAPVVLSVNSDARVMMVTASRSLIERVVFALQPVAIEGIYIRIVYKLLGTEGSWQTSTVQEETSGSVAIIGPDAGESYDFRLQYLHASFIGSPLTAINSYYVVGRTAPPFDLQNLTLGIISGQALLRWDLPEDIDVQIGGWIMFRHTPALDVPSWPNTTTIAQAVNGDQTHVFLPLKGGTYFGRVYDADGRQSLNAVSISTKQASLLAFSPVNNVQEDPTFTGVKAGCHVENNGLMLSTGDFDSIPNIDLAETWDITGSVVSAGLYKFAAGIDLGAIKKVRLTSTLMSEAVNEFDFWDSRTGNIDDWDDVDGTLHASVDASVYGKLTDDDPNASPTWGPFVRMDSLEVTNRAVGELECRMYSSDTTFNIWVTQLRLSAEEIYIDPVVLDFVLDGGGPAD